MVLELAVDLKAAVNLLLAADVVLFMLGVGADLQRLICICC
jgi:hypothetical protein